MKENIHNHLNSSAIRARHPREYEEIVRNCPTVVSAPASFLWSPNYAVGPGGIGIASKLPVRILIGIEPVSGTKVEYGPSRIYTPERGEFVDWESSLCNPLLIQLIEKVARKYGCKFGFRIWTLSELPWFRGLNVDSVWSAAMAGALLVHLGVIKSSEIPETMKLPSEALMSSAVFDKIFRLAWKMESTIAPGIADAETTFASVVDSEFPLLFFRERDPFLFDHYKDFGFEHPSSYYNVSDGLFWRGMRFNEAFEFTNYRLALDAAIVYTGEDMDSQFVYNVRGAHRAKLDEAASFVRSALTPFVPKTFREPPNFLTVSARTATTSPCMNLLQTYREISVSHSLTVLKTLHDLYQFGAAPNVMREFMDAQNLCQDILRLLGLSTLPIDNACMMMRDIGAKFSESGVAARLIGPGKVGCLAVFSPYSTLEKVLQEVAERRTAEGEPFHCHWASWCDGNAESAGLRIEQHVAENIHSPLTSSRSVVLREWRANGEKVTTLCPAEKVDRVRADLDLLLDAVDGKIYVRGEALTSADIKSAKLTIELFERLFASAGNEVRGADLPESSYRSDRNQMDSKIVRPLVTVLRKRVGKELPFEIHGGLGSQYAVSYRPDGSIRLAIASRG